MKRLWIGALFVLGASFGSSATAGSKLIVCFGPSPGGEFLDCASGKSGVDESKRNTSIYALYAKGWRLVGTQANTAQLAPDPQRAYYFYLEQGK